MWNKRILIWILGLILLVPLVFAAVPTHDRPLKVEGAGNANITGVNQTGADTDGDIIVFDYQWYYDEGATALRLNRSRTIRDDNYILFAPWDQDNTSDFGPSAHESSQVGTLTNVPICFVNGCYDSLTSSYVDYADSDDWHFQSTDFTFMTTIRYEESGASQILMSRTDDATNIQFIASVSTADNKLAILIASDGSTKWTDTPIKDDTVLVNGDVFHVVYTRSGNDYKIYLNGSLSKEATDSTTWFDSNAAFAVGGGTGEPGWRGLIDETQIWNRALSADEINRTYHGMKEGFAAIINGYTGTETDYEIEMTPITPNGEIGTPKNSTASVSLPISVTLVDTYDGITINNFTVTIFNDTRTFVNTTTTGTITFVLSRSE